MAEMPIMNRKTALRCLQFTMSAREWNADTADHVVLLLTQAGYPLITMPEGYRILVDYDVDYEPDGDYDLEEERRKLISGELGAYDVQLQKECDCGNWITKQSVGGVVVDHIADEAFSALEDITDRYILEVAIDLIMEESAA